MWTIVGPHALNGRTPESFYSMLERMGNNDVEIREVRENHERYWEEAVAFVQEQEGIESIVASGVERSLEVIPDCGKRTGERTKNRTPGWWIAGVFYHRGTTQENKEMIRSVFVRKKVGWRTRKGLRDDV